MASRISPHSSDLLSLPAELRNRTYEYTLTSEKRLVYLGYPKDSQRIVLAE
jgi:hypothetical protein